MLCSVCLLGDWGGFPGGASSASSVATENSVWGLSTLISGALASMNCMANALMDSRTGFTLWPWSCSSSFVSSFVEMTSFPFTWSTEIPESSATFSSSFVSDDFSLSIGSTVVSNVEEAESAEVSFGSKCFSSSSKARFSCDCTKGSCSAGVWVLLSVWSVSGFASDFVSLLSLSNNFGKLLWIKTRRKKKLQLKPP